jgi:uncharacterized CHY-type Zn-finger protein
METVKYHILERWGWECPKCGHWNEEDENPEYTDTLMCEYCQGEFEPEEV